MPGTAPPMLAFRFDPASSYSYLSAMRIESLAARAGLRAACRGRAPAP